MGYVKKIWISGVNGRLGSELYRLLNPMDYEILATDIDMVDITKPEEVNLFADRNRPNIIINASAMTDPKECEENPKQAVLINSLGARNMAVAARRINAKLVQLSTDDVFSGEKNEPYREFDQPLPVTIYGKSKLFGEQLVRDCCQTFFIIRSSWIYGEKNRRVEDILESAKKDGKVTVAKEQFAAPTSANELSKFISILIQTTEFGVYHAVTSGKASRKEFAEEVLRLANIKAEIEEKEELFNGVYRPDYTVLEPFILNISEIYQFPDWKACLRNYMEKKGVLNG